MDKIVLPGPDGEAEGAPRQCAVCCHRGLSTPRVRERSGEHSAYEVLDKSQMNQSPGLIDGNTFVCCKAKLRAVSRITGEHNQADNIIYPA